MGFHKNLLIVPFSLIVLVMAGCTTVTVPCAFPAPPKLHLPGLKNLCIAERVQTSSEDAEKEKMASNVSEYLTIAIQSWGGFTFVERKDLDLILKQIKKEVSDLFEDPAVAKQVGGLLGTDGLVLCDIKKYDYVEHTSTNRSCLDWWKALVFWSDLTPTITNTRTGTVTVMMIIKVLDLKTGVRHDAPEVYVGEQSDETEMDNAEPLPIARDTLYRELCQTLVSNFATAMFPSMEEEPVAFQKGGGWFGLYSSSKMDNGIIFAERGQYQEALNEFVLAREEARISDEKDHQEEEWKALLNISITQACLGRFLEAETTLAEAKVLLPDFKTAYFADSLAWIRERKQGKEKYDRRPFINNPPQVSAPVVPTDQAYGSVEPL